jgi:hypothetical protein
MGSSASPAPAGPRTGDEGFLASGPGDGIGSKMDVAAGFASTRARDERPLEQVGGELRRRAGSDRERGYGRADGYLDWTGST